MAYKSISGEVPFDENTEVSFDCQGLNGIGKISGISSELPIVGFLYIIETKEKISESYPYKSFVCPACYIKKLN